LDCQNGFVDSPGSYGHGDPFRAERNMYLMRAFKALIIEKASHRGHLPLSGGRRPFYRVTVDNAPSRYSGIARSYPG